MSKRDILVQTVHTLIEALVQMQAEVRPAPPEALSISEREAFRMGVEASRDEYLSELRRILTRVADGKSLPGSN